MASSAFLSAQVAMEINSENALTRGLSCGVHRLTQPVSAPTGVNTMLMILISGLMAGPAVSL